MSSPESQDVISQKSLSSFHDAEPPPVYKEKKKKRKNKDRRRRPSQHNSHGRYQPRFQRHAVASSVPSMKLPPGNRMKPG